VFYYNIHYDILCFEIVRDPRKNVLIPFNSNRKQYRDGYGMRLERQRYDGWYNNMAHPEWGAVGKCNQMILVNSCNVNIEINNTVKL
jgi:hypothetical protein